MRLLPVDVWPKTPDNTTHADLSLPASAGITSMGFCMIVRDRGQVAQCTEPLILSIDVNCRVRNSLTNPNPYMTMTSPLAARDGLRTRKACRLSLQRPGEWQSPVVTSFTTRAKTTRPFRGTGFFMPIDFIQVLFSSPENLR